MADDTNNLKFRSIEEVRRYLKTMSDMAHEDEQIAKRNIAALALLEKKAPETEEVTAKSVPLTALKPVPTDRLAILTKVYALCEQFGAKYQALINAENEARFAHKLPAEVSGSFNKARAQLETTMRGLFAAVASVSAKYAPAEYLVFAKSLSRELAASTHIQADAHEMLTYACPQENGTPSFTTYTILSNCISVTGRVAPHIYVAMHWTGASKVDIHLSPEFVMPRDLGKGVQATTLLGAAKAIAQLLRAEGFEAASISPAMRIVEAAERLRATLTHTKAA